MGNYPYQQQQQNYNDYGQYQDQYGDYQHQPYYNGYAMAPEETGYGYTAASRTNQQQQNSFRSGSLPRSIRKESTSFEHSEPLPGNLTRWPRPDPRLRNGEAYVELSVTLQRHESGFGFRIVGGTEEGSQV